MHDRPSHFTGRRKNPNMHDRPSHFTGRRKTPNAWPPFSLHREKKEPKCMTALLTSPGEEKPQMHGQNPKCMATLLTSPGEEKTQMGDHPSLLVPHTNLNTYLYGHICVKSQDY
jgi:hypothetical protein